MLRLCGSNADSSEVFMHALRFILILFVVISPTWIAVAGEKDTPLIVHKRAQLIWPGRKSSLMPRRRRRGRWG